MFLICLLWLAVAIHFPIGLVVSDLCVAITNLNVVNPTPTQQAVNQLINCSAIGSAGSSLQTTANNGIATAITSINSALVSNGVSGLTVTTSNWQNLPSLYQSSTGQTLPSDLQGYYNTATTYYNIYLTCLNLINCSDVTTAWTQIQNSFCVTTLFRFLSIDISLTPVSSTYQISFYLSRCVSMCSNGVNYLWEAFVALGLLFFALIIVAIVGYKRFLLSDILIVRSLTCATLAPVQLPHLGELDSRAKQCERHCCEQGRR